MMSDRPRLELSTVQVIASAGAAVTGAVLTSYLGDGGTILGTAVGSVASTTGFAVYKHYLARTREKVTPVLVEHARVWAPGTTTGGRTARAAGRPGGPGGAGGTVRYGSGNGRISGARAVDERRIRQFPTWDPDARTGRPAADPPTSATSPRLSAAEGAPGSAGKATEDQ